LSYKTRSCIPVNTVGQYKYRLIDMLEHLLSKISVSTQHEKQDLELHRYPTGDIRQHKSSLQNHNSQEYIQTIVNSTMGDSLGRASSVIDVVAQRGGVAMSVGAKQYDDNNTMQFWGSELVSNIPESAIHAIGSIPEDRWESVQGAGISTHANHIGIRIGPTINLISDMPEDSLANHNLQNPERFGFAHEPAANVRANMTTSSNDQNPNNSHALTPAGVQHTSYPHRPAVKYSDINTESDRDISRMSASNHSSTRYSPESPLRPRKTYRRMEGKASENPNMETSIESEIMRDVQSIAPRWATNGRW
jgi:hypothetical protein